LKTNHALHKNLDKEKKAIAKQWAKRDEQIEQVMQATVGIRCIPVADHDATQMSREVKA